jgi:hypothetical protein
MKTNTIREHDAAEYSHPVDHIEPQRNERNERIDLADAMMILVCWMTKNKNPIHIGARVLVLSNALNIDSASFASIGRDTGLTREAVRLMARELENEFGLRPNNSRSDATRRRCREARTQKGHKIC